MMGHCGASGQFVFLALSLASAFGADGVEVNSSRELASQTCGEAQNGDWAYWVIQCGGSGASCLTPACPLGFAVDVTKPTCTLADWEAPYCVPSTFWVRIFAPLNQPSVDNSYAVTVQAFASQHSLSVEENRPVLLVMTGQAGFARQWNVSMSAGEGTASLTHTVAEEVHLQLVGPTYSSFVDMGQTNVTFLPGATVRYVFSELVLHGTVDSSVRVRIEARDQYDNLATAEQRTLSIAYNTSKVSVVDFANGVGTALVLSRIVGSVGVRLEDPVHPTADVSSTMTVHFAAGAVYRYNFIPPTTSPFTAGTSATISVVAEDFFGNVVESESRGVTVVASRGSGGGAITFVNGRASTTVSHTVAELVILSLADHMGTGLDITSSITIQFVGGPAFSVLLEASPTHGTVDAPLQVSLKALDRYLNLATTTSESVRLVAPGAVVSPTNAVVSFTQGRATASIQSQIAQSVEVTLQDLGAGLDVSGSLSLEFLPGVPRAFWVEAPSSGAVGTPISMSVKAVDQYGNVAASSLSVTVQASSPGTVSNAGVVRLVDGRATAVYTGTEVGLLNLTLKDTFLTGLNVTSRAEMVLTAGPATRYVFDQQPGQPTASVDTTLAIAVKALDQFGNLADGEQRGVGVRTNASAASTLPVVITNGAGTLSLGRTVPDILTLSLVDVENTGLDVSSTVIVRFTAGEARSLTLLAGAGTTASVDAASPVTVVAHDQYGNLAAGSQPITMDVQLTGVEVGGSGQVQLVRGRGTIAVTSRRPQDVLVSLLDTYGTGLDTTAASLTLSFSAGVPARVTLSGAASASVGTPVTLLLVSFDQYGNEVSAGSAAAKVTGSGSATVANGGLVQLANGGGQVNVQNTKAETTTFSMQDSSSSSLDFSDTHTLLFQAEAATRFTFASDRSEASVDTPATVEVRALDRFGNLANNHNADVGYTSSLGGPAATVDISAGQGYLQVSHTIAEVVSLSLVDTLATGLDVATGGSHEITFLAGAGQRVQLQATTSPNGTVDNAIQVTARALDHYGNLATSERRAVELYRGLLSLGRVNFSNGEGVLPVPSTEVGTVIVSVEDTYGTGLETSSTVSLTFAAGLPARILLDPESGHVGAAVSVSLHFADKYGNRVLGTSSRVTLVASGSAVVFDNGIAELTGTGGVATVRNLKAETVTLSMEDSFSTGLDVSDRKSMVFLPNGATRYAFATVPEEASVDSAAEVTIHALDEYNNIATSQQADIGVQVSGLGSLALVDIASGVGTLEVARTSPQTVQLLLRDSQGTGLSVDGASANIIFVPGAGQVVSFSQGTYAGTVDAPVALALVVSDQYGNVAVSESRAVEVRTTAVRTAGLGKVDFVRGRASASITSELAQRVEVTLHDAYHTGLDSTATSSLDFGPGELRSFRLADSTGASRVVAKVGRAVPTMAQALDQFGNLATNISNLQLTAEIHPTPVNGTSGPLTWAVEGGFGEQDIQILSAGIFNVRISEVQTSTQASFYAAAADRSNPLTIECRYDLVPPDFSSLNVSILTNNEVVLNIYGLTEPSTVWCAAVDPGSADPLTPPSVSDGAVYAALRGPGNASSTPSARVGPLLEAGGSLRLSALEASTTYAIRCAAADEDGNQMVGQRILEHQLVVSTASAPITRAPPQVDEGDPALFIIGMIVMGISLVLCCCAVAFLLRARVMMRKMKQTVSKVVPWEVNSKQQAVVPQPSVGQSKADTTAAAKLAREIQHASGGDASKEVAEGNPVNDDTETEDSLKVEGQDQVLRDALAMQQELMDELHKRGVSEAEADDDYDSTDSDDSDTQAILRDVKAFLRKQIIERSEAEGTSNAQLPLVLPDLPLLLSTDDEARLSALVALGTQDATPWSSRLAHFDELWKTAQGSAWQEARELVRAEMQAKQTQIEASQECLQEAKAAVAKHQEESESGVLDALAAEEEAFSTEVDKRLRVLHKLAIDWPEEDASRRNALLAEWAPKIIAADSLPKPQRAQLRKEAIEELRKLNDDREDALQAELESFETQSTSRLEAMQEAQAESWRRLCEVSDRKALGLREEMAKLKAHAAAVSRQAEEAALQAALRLRRRLRDDAIEAEMAREAEERDHQLSIWRANILELLVGDEEEVAVLREKIIAVLERASMRAQKVAAEEQARRKRHWHEILEERSRDRLHAVRRRYQDEERKLMEAAGLAEEEASEADGRRRAVLVLGALHRAEAATLAVASSTRRARILMGLQATAAGSIAEEGVPRKDAGERRAATREASGTATPATPDIGSSGATMGATGLQLQDAKRRVALELNSTLDQIAEILGEHGQRQRSLLTQRQRREASMASAPEGEDERREDLLDALEENMRRELRLARWTHAGEEAEALAHRGAGEESELGRRLASVARDSQLLSSEDEIGERYDRLRALVLGPSGEEDYAMQQAAKALEDEAAALRAGLEQGSGQCEPRAAWEEAQDGPTQASETRLEVFQRPEDHWREDDVKVRQRRRADAMERARVLMSENRHHEACKLLLTALEDEENSATGQEVLAVRSVSETDWSATEAKRAKAMAESRQLLDEGRPQDAAIGLLSFLEDALKAEEMNTDTRSGDILTGFAEGKDLRQELLAQATEAARSRLQARRVRRSEAMEKARSLEAHGKPNEAAEVIFAVLEADDAEEETEASAQLELLLLREALTAQGGAIKQALQEDISAQRKRLAERQESSRRMRQERKEEAKQLKKQGLGEEAVQTALQLAEQLNQEETLAAKAIEGLPRDISAQESLPEGCHALFLSALAARNEAIKKEQEAQQSKLQSRRQRKEEARRTAAALGAEGKVQEALTILEETLQEEAAGCDWSVLKEDLSKRQDGVKAAMAGEAEAQRLRLERLQQERRRKREEAQSKAKVLKDQGHSQEAMDLMLKALEEDQKVAEEEWKRSQAVSQQLLDSFASGEAQRLEAFEREGEAQRQKAQARRLARQRQREEVEAQAQALEQKAAELRSESSQVRPVGSSMATVASGNDFDAVAEWQEAARRRAAIDTMASYFQKGQESAARRLVDAADEATGSQGALKDSFAAEMNKCGAAMADEREAQRRRAQIRLEQRRRQRQESATNPAAGAAASKVRKAVQRQIHGVHGLQKIHSRRRAKVVEEHRQVERRVRQEVEAELEALRLQLHLEADHAVENLGHKEVAPPEIPEPKDENGAKRALEVGLAKKDEVKDQIQTERQRQAERIEARLAQRRARLRKHEVAVTQYHQVAEARVELDQGRERLQASTVSKAKRKTLMKELHKVNNIIAGLTTVPGGGPGDSRVPSRMSASASPALVHNGVRTRLVEIQTESQGSDEEV